MSGLADNPVRQGQSPLDVFGHDLAVATVELSMHEPSSEPLANAAKRLDDALDLIRAEDRAEAEQRNHRVATNLRVELTAGRVRARGKLLLGASLQAGQLLRSAHEARVLAIDLGLQGPEAVTGKDLVMWLDVLRRPNRPDDPSTWQAAMDRAGVRGVQVILDGSEQRRALDSSPLDRLTAPDHDPTHALEDYQRIAEVLQANHVAAWRGEDIDIDAASGIVERTLKTLEREPSALLALAHYDDIDRFTVGHSVRVALLAMHVAAAAGAKTEGLMRVGTAALLHDVGKGRISQDVLFKPGKLDPDEWHQMAQHPRLGAEVLIGQRGLHASAVTAAFCHHLAPDGSGYPRAQLGLRPGSISRLVRICDMFEALTAIRPYKSALSPVEAYVIMHRNGGQGLDGRWLSFFVRTIGLYPLGTPVLLADGSRGVVEAGGPRADRPVVRVVSGPQGTVIDDGSPQFVTVGEDDAGKTVQLAEPIEVEPSGRDAEQLAHEAAGTVGGACLGDHEPGKPCDQEHGPTSDRDPDDPHR